MMYARAFGTRGAPSLVTKAAAEFSEISHHITVKSSYGQIHRDLYVILQNITHKS